jgi:hypothetical protein
MADPVERLATANREYGEYGGVNPSIEISTTFTGERAINGLLAEVLDIVQKAPRLHNIYVHLLYTVTSATEVLHERNRGLCALQLWRLATAAAAVGAQRPVCYQLQQLLAYHTAV